MKNAIYHQLKVENLKFEVIPGKTVGKQILSYIAEIMVQFSMEELFLSGKIPLLQTLWVSGIRHQRRKQKKNTL